MPKWLLFGLAAVGDFVLAAVAYFNDRPIMAGIFALAGLLFVVAAAGSAKKPGGGSA